MCVCRPHMTQRGAGLSVARSVAARPHGQACGLGPRPPSAREAAWEGVKTNNCTRTVAMTSGAGRDRAGDHATEVDDDSCGLQPWLRDPDSRVASSLAS